MGVHAIAGIEAKVQRSKDIFCGLLVIKDRHWKTILNCFSEAMSRLFTFSGSHPPSHPPSVTRGFRGRPMWGTFWVWDGEDVGHLLGVGCDDNLVSFLLC
ncbi:hypothetical protein VNO77_43958 [Canavalia gladiata]|uniref:Uncharacterized protein n=1 Tax=Canavalia gladiata TaxID=3824 RepID=A0AAN9JXE1_CANGL